MVAEIMSMFGRIFYQCADWFNLIIASFDGAGVIISAFVVALVVNLLFMPLRGGSLVASWDTFRDFNVGVIHKGKYSSGSWTLGTRSRHYKGKFEKGNDAAKLSRRGSHTRYYAGGSGKQGI